jgi:hypothetical protein
MRQTQHKLKKRQRSTQPSEADIIKKKVKKFIEDEAEEGDESEIEQKVAKDCEIYTKEFL